MKLRVGTAILLAIFTVLSFFLINSDCLAKGVELSKNRIIIKKGNTKQLKVKNTNKKIIWTSRNKKIAKVSPKGVVTGIKSGKTTIKAKVGKKKMYCKVTVSANVKIVYSNDVFTKEVYNSIKHITANDLYGKKKITSKDAIATIYKILAGISTMHDITDETPQVPVGGTTLEFVMKDGTVKKVNVSSNIFFNNKWYQPDAVINTTVASLLRKYLKY